MTEDREAERRESGTEGSDLYTNVLAYDYGDPKTQEVMKEVWEPTPWMLDTYTGSAPFGRYREIRDWCREEFGQEARPLRGIKGCWQIGGEAIHGRTWIGFATEEQMNRFADRWPAPEDKP